MRISHETPLDFLDLSLTFNDYQYCLPHYWEKYPKYKEFFLKYRKMKNSFVFLDNGLFEGGVFPEEKLLEIINELKPDIFIIPDTWNNSYKTFEAAEYWSNLGLDPKIRLMVVVQGTNLTEFEQLIHDSQKIGIKHFGFNHSSTAYSKVFSHSDPLISKMMGRIIMLNNLFEMDVFDDLKKCYLHLLGVNLPQEMFLLGNIKKYFSSIDTSNPILVGALGKRYNEMGINFKPEQKIEAFMEEDLASKIDDIIFNVNLFKKFTI